MSDEVLRVEDLRVYFPHKSRGVFPRTIGQICRASPRAVMAAIERER